MATLTLEERVATLENKFDSLIQEKQESLSEAQKYPKSKDWLERWFGAFKDSDAFEAAMMSGAEYRRAQPNPADDFDAITFDDECETN